MHLPAVLRRPVAAVLALLFLLGSAGDARAAVGTRAPDFTLPAAPGGPSRGRFRLAEHINRRPVVVLFWATYCTPCTNELQLYQQLREQYGDRLAIVAIALDGPDSITSVGPTALQLGVRFPVVTDLDTSVTNQYNQRRAMPFSVWIDREGNIVREREGFSMSEADVIRTGIAQLVGPARP